MQIDSRTRGEIVETPRNYGKVFVYKNLVCIRDAHPNDSLQCKRTMNIRAHASIFHG